MKFATACMIATVAARNKNCKREGNVNVCTVNGVTAKYEGYMSSHVGDTCAEFVGERFHGGPMGVAIQMAKNGGCASKKWTYTWADMTGQCCKGGWDPEGGKAQ